MYLLIWPPFHSRGNIGGFSKYRHCTLNRPRNDSMRDKWVVNITKEDFEKQVKLQQKLNKVHVKDFSNLMKYLCKCSIISSLLAKCSELYRAHGPTDLWKPSKPCHIGFHWMALNEYSQMSTHLPSHFSGVFFASFIMAKLATSNIRVNITTICQVTFQGVFFLHHCVMAKLATSSIIRVDITPISWSTSWEAT